MPRRADIDPADLRAHLAGLSLVDVMEDASDFRFRLLGTDITDRYGRNMTGKLLSQAYADAPDLLRWMTEVLAHVARLQRPILARSPLSIVSKNFILRETLSLPLSESGERVDMILGRTQFVSAK